MQPATVARPRIDKVVYFSVIVILISVDRRLHGEFAIGGHCIGDSGIELFRQA
jgi:hypothetical protein